MPTNNTRRRFLAFLGLAGAPAALWAASARAQDAAASSSSAVAWPQSVVCQTSEPTPAYSLSFKNSYVLSGGKLTGDSEPQIGISALPLRTAYGTGFGDATKTGGDVFNIFGSVLSLDDRDYGLEGTFSTRLRASEALAAGKLFNVTSGLPLTDIVNFTAVPDESGVYDISVSFVPEDSMMDAPVTLRLELNDKTAATFDYDVSGVDVAGYVARMKAKYAALSGITADTSFVYGANDCSLPVDYTGTGAACFFTTAAVGTLGLSDDCWELTTLRRFRDGPLATTPEGRALTARYYAQAPRLVAGVNTRSDAASIWLGAYWSHVLPCAVLARLGLDSLAVSHYRHLFTRLQRLAAV